MIRQSQNIAGRQNLLQHFICDRRGLAATEFAALATILIFMSIATADLGMGFYRKMQVQNAAQAGARYVMLKGLDTAGIVNSITEATSFSAIVASDPIVFYGCASAEAIAPTYQNATCSDGKTAGRYVTVSTQATYNPLLPFPLLPNSFTLEAQFTVRVP